MHHWEKIANDQTIERTMAALQKNGMTALVVADGAAAKHKVLELVPAGAEVMTMTSVTLETIGLAEALQTSQYQSVRKRLNAMDRKTQGGEMQKLGAAPDWAVGSVQAITENGEIVIASNTGSQLPAYAYGANHVILVVGAQKIVPDMATATQRIYDYVLPRESERARQAYGVAGSFVSKMLTIHRENIPGRLTVIFVKERLGF